MMIRPYIIFALLIPFFISGCQDGSGTGIPLETEIHSQGEPGNELLEKSKTEYISFSNLGSNEYEITQQINLVNHGPGSPSKYNLWVALVRDVYPYQEVLERNISPGGYQLFTDEYGNHVAEFDFSEMPPESKIEVQITYRVKINRLESNLDNCSGDLPDFFTDPELHIESQNPQIVQLSAQLSKGKSNSCEQVRAFYDYTGEELVYSYNGGNWGAQAALGEMGADCTEYASLMIALSRAAGIPARYIEGLSSTPEGKEALARQEHAWLEVYLPGIGWTPMDPTLGRSSITRDQYFGKLPPDHIIVTRGRNPSSMRGGSYWTHLYWPGSSAEIKIEQAEWVIIPLDE